MSDRFWTIREIAELYQISVATVYRHAAAGHLTITKVGCMSRVSEADRQNFERTFATKGAPREQAAA